MAESFASSSTQAGQTARPPTVPPIPVAVRTLGCKVNQVESEDIATELIGRGSRLAPEEEAAVVVVNTCTVTGEADRKARKLVRHMLRLPQSPVVVVTGCMAAVDRAGLEALGDRVLVETDKERVADRVADLTAGIGSAGHDAASSVDRATRAMEDAASHHRIFHTRAMLKIQDGCDSFCAYCIVPHARGNPRSVPVSNVLDRARQYVASGASELVLTGVNLGRYNDEDGTRTFGLPELVEAISGTGVKRLRLSSIEPMDITDELLSSLVASGVACPHLHVPLQSGSDTTLSAMGRGYTSSEFEARIESARAAIPGIAVTTDVMAGFPGETDEDARETLEFCRRIAFAKMHVFRYSARKGTRAAQMSEQVPPGVRAERAQALRELGEEMRGEFIAGRLGAEASLLVEEIGGSGMDVYARGTTGDYLRARCVGCEARIGEILQVRVGGPDGSEVLVKPL